MALTQDRTGFMRVLDTPEPPHVALLHQKVADSHNAGKRTVLAHRLHSEVRPVFPQIGFQEVLQVLIDLERKGFLEEEDDEREVFLHTSTPGFRLEYASTDYRRAISDLHMNAEGDLYALLDHADDAMRAVKSAGKDPSRARELLARLRES